MFQTMFSPFSVRRHFRLKNPYNLGRTEGECPIFSSDWSNTSAWPGVLGPESTTHLEHLSKCPPNDGEYQIASSEEIPLIALPWQKC